MSPPPHPPACGRRRHPRAQARILVQWEGHAYPGRSHREVVRSSTQPSAAVSHGSVPLPSAPTNSSVAICIKESME